MQPPPHASLSGLQLSVAPAGGVILPDAGLKLEKLHDFGHCVADVQAASSTKQTDPLHCTLMPE